ncbi:hypothetical protein C8Q76DRAFT_619633 [Earliella scabrosa]|nr:hypothetical protein C8Q76DRAFT_619633 [Earliella scabrosa]
MPGSVRPEPRIAVPKAPLAQPIPGLSKSSRGRHVPKRGANEAADRKHCCPVPGCVKMFTKRDHLNRHIKSLHQHDKEFFCPIPNCDKSFTRADNYNRHWRKHQSHTQEIFACSPEDDYKGVHLENPIFTQGGDFLDIKPFANIAIHPLAFDLWHWRETERREGRDPPGKTACDRYFDAHPEERESAFRRDPKWEWRLPPPGPEFTPVDHRGSLQGEFKLNIKSQST